jgi:hypothetical protein
MTIEELHEKIVAAKRFLNLEIVKIKTLGHSEVLGFREIGEKLDLIHEVERVGIRNLPEVKIRKISRLITQLDSIRTSHN